MANTIGIFKPYGCEFPTTNFPQLTVVSPTSSGSTSFPVLAFDATTQETCMWSSICPQGYVGTTVTAIASCIMASATSGSVVFGSSVEAVTPGDALNLSTTDSFDTVYNSIYTLVPSTAGYMFSVSMVLTNKDSMAIADRYRLRLQRIAASAGDTATGDCQVLTVELRDG